jgi:hypothetical protein
MLGVILIGLVTAAAWLLWQVSAPKTALRGVLPAECAVNVEIHDLVQFNHQLVAEDFLNAERKLPAWKWIKQLGDAQKIDLDQQFAVPGQTLAALDRWFFGLREYSTVALGVNITPGGQPQIAGLLQLDNLDALAARTAAGLFLPQIQRNGIVCYYFKIAARLGIKMRQTFI